MPPPQRNDFISAAINPLLGRITRIENTLKQILAGGGGGSTITSAADDGTDLEILAPGKGVILTSPDGSIRKRLRIDDTGAITTETV